MCLQKKQERDKRKELAAMKAKSQKDLELIQIIKVSNLTFSYISLSLSSVQRGHAVWSWGR